MQDEFDVGVAVQRRAEFLGPLVWGHGANMGDEPRIELRNLEHAFT